MSDENLSDRWLVWSNEHKAWWNPQGYGYTQDPKEAGRFTLEEACEICRNANYAEQQTPMETMVREIDMKGANPNV